MNLEDFARVHGTDYVGPFMHGAMFMIVVDAHSKWVEIVQISSTTSFKTIAELQKLFQLMGFQINWSLSL